MGWWTYFFAAFAGSLLYDLARNFLFGKPKK